MALRIEVCLGPRHIVLDEDQAPLLKQGGRALPQFSVHFYCGQTAECIKMPLGMEVGLIPGDFVLDGDPASPLSIKRRSPQFSAHVYCGQTAAWITMPLGTGVCLGLRDIVLDGDPAPPSLRGHSALSRPMSVMAKRLDESRYATWCGGKPRPRRRCVRWGRSSRDVASVSTFRSRDGLETCFQTSRSHLCLVETWEYDMI